MNLDATLSVLAHDPSAPVDLAELALHLARDEYPDLDVEAYLSELAAMAHEARAYLRGDLKARVNELCRYLFHEMGFRGNTPTYYDPRNSYLNQVLDRRTGIPITLSVVVMAVAARAELDVVGVGLPGHFIVKAVEGEEEILLDPFHGGRFLSSEQCEILVRQMTGQEFEVTPEHLQALPLGLMAVRMLTNLKGVYFRQEDFPRLIRVIERLRQLVPHDLDQRRDLGYSLIRAGQLGQAVDHLQAYLHAVPKANDIETVENLLQQTRSELAKWN